jgi:FAD/FMN-containing dehydrogenase
MTLHPANREELSALLAAANASGRKVRNFDLARLAGLLEHKVEDMTARVETGMTLAVLQEHLQSRGQWLPVDPPSPERLSLGSLLASDASGPRRFGCGTIRDHLLGLTVALADGRLIRSGGNVVKNVAGYDLMKVFIGSRGSLGVLVEATFKLRPVPGCEKFVEAQCVSLPDADKLVEAVLDSELAPLVLDLHSLWAAPNVLSLVLGFAGTTEEVEWQLSKAAALGFMQPSSLDYEKKFHAASALVNKVSVLPSQTTAVIGRLGGARFVARMGNGIVYHDGPAIGPAIGSNEARNTSAPGRIDQLTQRLKDEFDPKHILPEPPP